MALILFWTSTTILSTFIAESKRCATELEKIHAANGGNPAPLGQYKPKCDVNGDFEVVQSHEGYNWCVDTTSGKEIKDTRKRFAKPDCKRVISKVHIMVLEMN